MPLIVGVITCLCHTLSYNHHGSKVFQRTPVKDCNKPHSTQPKAAPTPPCILGSLGRKVNKKKKQPSQAATPVDCAPTHCPVAVLFPFLFSTLLQLLLYSSFYITTNMQSVNISNQCRSPSENKKLFTKLERDRRGA